MKAIKGTGSRVVLARRRLLFSTCCVPPTCCPVPWSQLLKTEDLSATQYNVLRILRGAPEGLACGEWPTA